jgi:hypothetical protein
MQKLLSLAVVGLVASSAANAESKTSFSVISTSTDYSYSTAKIAVDMTGFAIGTTIDINEQFFLTGAYSALSGTASLGLSGTTIATGNVDQDTLTLGAGINLTNDLDRQAGTGSNLKAALAYSKTDIGTLSANNTLIGLKYDFALAKKVSINTTFSGVIDDFNPAYGVGISYTLRGGDLFAGYAFTEDNVAGIKIEDSALNVGYSFNF